MLWHLYFNHIVDCFAFNTYFLKLVHENYMLFDFKILSTVLYPYSYEITYMC